MKTSQPMYWVTVEGTLVIDLNVIEEVIRQKIKAVEIKHGENKILKKTLYLN